MRSDAMAMSNAQRQARYRERREMLAKRAALSPRHAEHLAKLRVQLRAWRRSLAGFAAGAHHMYTNGIDTSADHIVMLRDMIARNDALLAHYDPDGITADGHVEIGDVSPF